MLEVGEPKPHTPEHGNEGVIISRARDTDPFRCSVALRGLVGHGDEPLDSYVGS